MSHLLNWATVPDAAGVVRTGSCLRNTWATATPILPHRRLPGAPHGLSTPRALQAITIHERTGPFISCWGPCNYPLCLLLHGGRPVASCMNSGGPCARDGQTEAKSQSGCIRGSLGTTVGGGEQTTPTAESGPERGMAREALCPRRLRRQLGLRVSLQPQMSLCFGP